MELEGLSTGKKGSSLLGKLNEEIGEENVSNLRKKGKTPSEINELIYDIKLRCGGKIFDFLLNMGKTPQEIIKILRYNKKKLN